MSETGRGPLRKGPKPIVRYDFGQSNLPQHLPSEAVRALRASNLGTNRMEQELRNYYRYRGADEVRLIRVLQIVSRYVTVLPISVADMVMAMGKRNARESLPVGPFTWLVMDFLDYVDLRALGHPHRAEVYFMIEKMHPDPESIRQISARHLKNAGYTAGDVFRHHREVGERLVRSKIRA